MVNGVTTFTSGSTYSGTPMQIGNGHAVEFAGIGTFTGPTGSAGLTQIGQGGELDIVNGGTLTDINQLILSNPGAGWLDVIGPGSKYTNTGSSAQIGQFSGKSGQLWITNSGDDDFQQRAESRHKRRHGIHFMIAGRSTSRRFWPARTPRARLPRSS